MSTQMGKGGATYKNRNYRIKTTNKTQGIVV